MNKQFKDENKFKKNIPTFVITKKREGKAKYKPKEINSHKSALFEIIYKT